MVAPHLLKLDCEVQPVSKLITALEGEPRPLVPRSRQSTPGGAAPTAAQSV